MMSLKVFLVTIVLLSIVLSELADAAPASKKHRHHSIKPKKSNGNTKLKATFKKAAAQPAANRNAKMNLYHSRSWPSTSSSFYHAPSMPLFLRSTPSSLYYPSMRWGGNHFLTSPSSMMSNYLRRADDFPTMSTASPMSSLMSLGGSQTPTILDMSAFTGNGMMENGFPSQSLWSMPEISGSGSTGSKSKMNLFNGFSLNEDGGLFGSLFNQFK